MGEEKVPIPRFEDVLEAAVEECYVQQGERPSRESLLMQVAHRAGEVLADRLALLVVEKALSGLDLDAMAVKVQAGLEGRVETALLNRLATSDWMQAKVIKVAADVAAAKASGDDVVAALQEKNLKDSEEMAGLLGTLREVTKISPLVRLGRLEQALARVELCTLAEATRLGLPASTSVLEYLNEKGRMDSLKLELEARMVPALPAGQEDGA